MKMKKKTLIIILFLFVLPLVANAGYLDSILIGIKNAMIKIAAAVVIVMFLWAAILFATASGEPDKITKAKKAFIWSIAAAIVAIIATSMFSLISELTGL